MELGSNTPVANAELTLLGYNLTTRTDSLGRYVFTGVAVGYNIMQAEASGYVPRITESFPVSTAAPAIIDIQLQPTTKNLEEVTVPETVTTLGMNLFQGSALKRAAVNAVIDARSRCSNMFLDCVLLEEVTLSENVESLQSSMFENCVSLKEIDLPESVTAIDMSAFEGAGITEFVYRSGMTLSNYAFRNSALK